MGIFGVEKAARQEEVANAELYTFAVICANFWVVYSKRELVESWPMAASFKIPTIKRFQGEEMWVV